ncbi:MAG: hypothetical protein V2I43_07025 [Parvularcula sp.]|jgi:hypothetical protein|nr:hypothetical protein [Parvularcula sp.]
MGAIPIFPPVKQFILPVSVALLLAACASTPEEDLSADLPPAPHSLDLGDNLEASEAVASDFTGCLEGGPCFVEGMQVDARRRFEAHSGRAWFLDPSTGRTIYKNGEIRSAARRPSA